LMAWHHLRGDADLLQQFLPSGRSRRQYDSHSSVLFSPLLPLTQAKAMDIPSTAFSLRHTDTPFRPPAGCQEPRRPPPGGASALQILSVSSEKVHCQI